MNSIIEDYYPTFRLYQGLRTQLIDSLVDQDLLYQPSPANAPLGALCKEIGEIEYAYIQSFRTFELDFGYRHPDSELAKSVARLSAWYESLDQELEAVISDLTEADVQNRQIDRGGGFHVRPLIQLTIYNEALLIFYGKTSVYLRALEKSLTEQWQHWID